MTPTSHWPSTATHSASSCATTSPAETSAGSPSAPPPSPASRSSSRTTWPAAPPTATRSPPFSPRAPSMASTSTPTTSTPPSRSYAPRAPRSCRSRPTSRGAPGTAPCVTRPATWCASTSHPPRSRDTAYTANGSPRGRLLSACAGYGSTIGCAVVVRSANAVQLGELALGEGELSAVDGVGQVRDGWGAGGQEEGRGALERPGERDGHRCGVQTGGDRFECVGLQWGEAAEREVGHVGDVLCGKIGRASCRVRGAIS